MRPVGCDATMPHTVAEASIKARLVAEPRAWHNGNNKEKVNTAAMVTVTVEKKGGSVHII
ncbi:hypothetical protein Lal_00048096 [Lupinus albus]|nr:hypothetical protein Lal_00048096 [Lupinus albus]